MFTILLVVLALILAYALHKLYRDAFLNELEDYVHLLGLWKTALTRKDGLRQEFHLAGYEFWDCIKAFIEPLKTLGRALIIVFAPIIAIPVCLISMILDVHRNK